MQKSSTPTIYRQELREKIAATALKEFRSKGIKGVKMDDIAQSLSISKRTLYEIYETKEGLLLEVLKQEEEKNKAYLADFARRVNHNVIDVIMEFYQMKMKVLSDINPAFLYDLRRSKRLNAFQEKHQKESNSKAVEFYQRGVSQGYFRKDVEFLLIISMCNISITHIMLDRSYKEYNLKTIFRNIIMLLFRGICTEKGVREIDKRMKLME